MRLIYFSAAPWSSFAQRPHKFVEWFHSQTGGAVLWIDPYPSRLPCLADFRRPREIASTGTIQPEWINVIRPKSLPIEPLPFSGAINKPLWKRIFETVKRFASQGETMLGIGRPSELALQLLKQNHCTESFYDAMDDFPAFYNGISRRAIAQREDKIVDRVSFLIVSSTCLLSRWKHRKHILLARNACDTVSLPPYEESSGGNNSILGYVGTIGKWFDWKLVASIANARPAARVVLIGPMFSRPPEELPKNIEIFPACSHKDALSAMQRFSIGLIPFLKTELTESVDPIKYYEYRSLGIPVISSNFGEMKFHHADPGLFLLDDGSDLSSVIDEAAATRCSDEWISEFRRNNSWDARFTSLNLIKRRQWPLIDPEQ